MRFQERVVVVTGSGSGIGRVMAEQFAAEGARVAVVDWLGDRAEAVASEMPGAVAVSADVSSGAGVQSMMATVDSRLGPVDVLVNNAGVTRDMTFRKMDRINWEAVMHTNLDSCFNMTKQVCDGMSDRGWGRVINISSVNGQKGAFGQTNYSAAKAGMHGFTKALSLEVARKGVTVNTISPGYIGTAMVTAIPRDILESKIIPQIPMGRLGKPEEVAGLVAYLASDEAAFVTGANIAINGGQHMQ